MLEFDIRPPADAKDPATAALPTPQRALAANLPGHDPDEAFVDAWVNRGDPVAFASLVESHQAYVFRLALSVLGPGNEGDAQDVTQEVFIRVADRLQDFRGESRFRTWLHRLAVNLALDCRRRPRWRKPHVDPTILERRPAVRRADDPFVSAEDAERSVAVGECLDALPGPLRRVIHLHYWLDLTVDDIAAMLNLAPGTVKSHLHRGRKLLFLAMQGRGLSRHMDREPLSDPLGMAGAGC